MMIKFLAKSAVILAAVTPVWALDVHVEVPPGGNSARLAGMISEFRQTKGHKSEVKFNPSCTVAAARFDAMNDKAVLVLATANQTKSDCALDLKKSKFKIIDTMFTITNSLCYRADRAELGMAHFTNAKIKKQVATTVAGGVSMITRVSDRLGSGATASLNVVVVGNSGVARQTVLANEFDYVLLDTDWAVTNSDKVKCLFTGNKNSITTPTHTIPALESVLPGHKPARWQDMLFVVGVNLTENEIQRTRQELREMKKSYAPFVTLVSTPGRFANVVEDGIYEKIMEINQ